MINNLINRLDKVKQTGKDRYIARCPSHEDRSPSLAIREVDDRVLIHCFAGCSAHEVVSAVGLDLSDLFPESKETHKSLSRPFPASDVLRCISFESLFLKICALHLKNGEQLSDKDYGRLKVSHNRIVAA
ncbi:MAG TPA: DNA primase, partial [Thiotrichaceae bacterium]|nr:DNA primase [Thiotrichaceae bacterium]